MRASVVVLLAGCATGQASAPLSVREERGAQRSAQCEESAAHGEGYEALKSALEYGGLASLYLALRGAADGAWWGAVTGGSAGQGAWIGAAAGAGLGTIIGVAVGVKNGVDTYTQYRRSYEACLAQRPAPRSGDIEDPQRD